MQKVEGSSPFSRSSEVPANSAELSLPAAPQGPPWWAFSRLAPVRDERRALTRRPAARSNRAAVSSDGSIRRGVRQDAPETREAVPPSRRNESCRCRSAAQIEHASTLSGRSPEQCPPAESLRLSPGRKADPGRCGHGRAAVRARSRAGAEPPSSAARRPRPPPLEIERGPAAGDHWRRTFVVGHDARRQAGEADELARPLEAADVPDLRRERERKQLGDAGWLRAVR